MIPELEGRVAIVTGSSSGIGEAVARHLSLAGVNVVVNSSTSTIQGQRVADALPTDSICIQADSSNAHRFQGLVDQALKRFGRLDIAEPPHQIAGEVTRPGPGVAAAVMSLITNPYVSGEIFVVDGGLTQTV